MPVSNIMPVFMLQSTYQFALMKWEVSRLGRHVTFTLTVAGVIHTCLNQILSFYGAGFPRWPSLLTTSDVAYLRPKYLLYILPLTKLSIVSNSVNTGMRLPSPVDLLVLISQFHSAGKSSAIDIVDREPVKIRTLHGSKRKSTVLIRH